MTVSWKDQDAARHFVGNRKHMPGMGELFEAATQLVRDLGRDPDCIVDLGCGSGDTGTALRMLWPSARLRLVDNSPPMLELARERYGRDEAVAIIDADLAEPGVMSAVTPEPVDVVVSSMAIHHLPRPRQRELYREIFEALKPGGVFVNLEHVASATPRLERLFWRWFYERVAASRRAAGESITTEQVRAEFESRQELNVLTPVDQQLTWLREIGFVSVDCVYKVHELAVFGGYKDQ
jgi:SAM-dependent methyltransferase